MKTRGLTLITILILLFACSDSQVRIQGTVHGLEGSVRLLAEVPGERGFAIVAQQEVQNGLIDLRSDELVPPAQVWLDIRGKRMVELYIDSYKDTRVNGVADSLDDLKISGSLLMEKYMHVARTLYDKFGPDLALYNARILDISKRENLSRDEEIQLGRLQLERQRAIGRRAEYVKHMIRNNPRQELSLFLIRNELMDSLDAQRKLFHAMVIANKESNIYKLLERRLP
jgi:hypothetical protein